jgi:DNA replication and repair protein RecF
VTGLKRLILSDFRSYAALDLDCGAPMVVFVGENGAGKTNILEAVSLLSAGRGLRRADLADMARQGGAGGFALSATLEGALGRSQLGTGFDPRRQPPRVYRIDGANAPSASAFADHVRLVWLTPENDGLFRGPPGDRRRFLDRLVLAVDAEHGARANALDRALRSRNRLLEADAPDPRWLDAVESELAEIAVAVAAARGETVQRLAAIIAETAESASVFPFAQLELAGDLERSVLHQPAAKVEDTYRETLARERWRDRAAGRTLIGPNTADLLVTHGPKQQPADLCSTGEQKALLIGLVLAHARLVSRMSGIAPIVLLDEVAAHLDSGRRAALYRDLLSLGGQVWMTGTDRALFAELPEDARMFGVANGSVAAI